MSYFVGGEAMHDEKFLGEDAGFAINGGRGWSEVVFRNHMIALHGDTAHAMGEYIFTDATSGDDVTVQYTFGYKRCGDGATRNPFRPTAGDAMSYFVGGEAMKDDKFKGEDAGFAINGGRGWSEVVFRNHMIDVRGTTAHAMGEYIFTDATSKRCVKPTKATKNPFRPTAGDAMSYFVGGSRARMPVSRSTAGAGGLRWCSGTT
eukprot:TRINITY_DN496_c0_g1_i2.p1 TRINITY_DN496_c0_g1~~TRINITY_DN496_c0_g1_i2.p1  ORF type:complete len:229 (+),score=55.41 TRINITY_DN496_c0_g1_i2:77-688(+)